MNNLILLKGKIILANRKVFISESKYFERAYFGWQDQNSALYGVKKGYLNSANELVDLALQKADIATLDTYIFPIFFLYRHAIEVSMKAIYYRFYGKIPEGKHDLKVLWDRVHRDVIKETETQEFKEMVKGYKANFIEFSLNEINFTEIENMIIEIHKKDTQSDVFRYLVDKKGKLHFTDGEFIDYPNLKESMNYLFDVLDYIYTAVDEYLSS